MPLDLAPGGICSICNGPLVCRFNYFDRGDLQIHAWEHKCSDCGKRETTAFRSDADPKPTADPALCPYCGRRPATAG